MDNVPKTDRREASAETVHVSVRLSGGERAVVDAYAAAHGVGPSTAIRQMIAGYEGREYTPELYRRDIDALGRRVDDALAQAVGELESRLGDALAQAAGRSESDSRNISLARRQSLNAAQASLGLLHLATMMLDDLSEVWCGRPPLRSLELGDHGPDPAGLFSYAMHVGGAMAGAGHAVYDPFPFARDWKRWNIEAEDPIGWVAAGDDGFARERIMQEGADGVAGLGEQERRKSKKAKREDAAKAAKHPAKHGAKGPAGKAGGDGAGKVGKERAHG